MPELQILFAKAKDPTAQDVLTCMRSDGSRTWSKLDAVFPIHDMTHYAVETELNAKDGFFGLIAQGWDITDFGIPEKRAKMPLEALWVEHVVGIVWTEYVTGDSGSYPEFCEAINATVHALRESLNRNLKRQGPRADYSASEQAVLGRVVSEASRVSIMKRIGELANQWAQTPPSERLVLAFALG